MALERSDAELLKRIESFAIDGSEAALPFSVRLASEQGWSRPHAERVIREYKRYVYLAVTSDTPVCPSEDVDAAWHLHLTYTRSYWTRFCGEVLGRKLHHDPTRGGPAEATKHFRMYEATLAIYRATFGAEPPGDIWPPSQHRFGDDRCRRMVNTARNWIIPKLPVKRALQLAAAFIIVATLVPGCAGGEANPFNLVGTDFLFFLIPMMVGAVCVGRVFRASVRKPYPQPGDSELELTWEQAAFLAGGYPRLTTAAIARLVETGAARIDDETNIIVRGNEPSPGTMSRIEQLVADLMPFGNKPADLRPVRETVEAAFASEADRLEAEGFLLPKSRRVAIALASVLPFAGVIVFLALPRLAMGFAAGKPSGYLLTTIFFGGVVGIAACLLGNYRLSRRGQNLLGSMKANHKTRRSGRVSDAAMAVALFGPAALVGTSIAYLGMWYPRRTSDGGGCGSGCGSSDGGGGGGCGGGGGGGGGGCGGCGGGD
jgi:uncharacterized protein (TIGR04222 family)